MSDPVMLALIAGIPTFTTALFGYLSKVASDRNALLSMQNAQHIDEANARVADVHAQVVEVKKNTDGMIEKMRKSATDDGFRQGAEAATNQPGPQGATGEKGERGESGATPPSIPPSIPATGLPVPLPVILVEDQTKKTR